MITEITQAIDQLSNLKTLHQLEKETQRANDSAKELKQRTQIHEYRLQQATEKMKKIEDDERERCKKTSDLLKEFEKNSANGPFFNSLLDILTNFQGIYDFYILSILNA